MIVNFTYCSRYNKGILKLDDKDLFNAIREKYSTIDDFSKDQRRKYLITPLGRFDIGLFFVLYKIFKKLNVNINVSSELLDKVIPNNFKDFQITPVENSKFQLRDYQEAGIYEAFKFGRGIFELGTGGGKTLILASIIESVYKKINKKIFILVPDLSLVNQTFNDFNEYQCSFSFSKWCGNSLLNLDTKVIIANVGIINRCDKKLLEWFSDVDLFFIDEAHKIKKGSKLNDKIKNIKCKNIFGLTGTLPLDDYTRNYILSVFGNVIYAKPSYELIEEGYLTKVYTQFIHINHYDTESLAFEKNRNLPTDNYYKELEFINNSIFRKEKVKNICNSINNNILILVERIEEGNKLHEYLSNYTDKKVYFIYGDTDVQDRLKIINEIEKNDDIICIAMSKIFSTGISINNLYYILFWYLGKSFTKTIQSVGRSLRLCEDKDKAIIFDFYDNTYYSTSHKSDRELFYQKEKIPYRIKEFYE